MIIDNKTKKLLTTEQTLYIGVIEDNKDEEFLGRYRVRILGLDTDDIEELPTEDLPYATTTLNVFSGIGFTTFYKKGTYVIVWLPLGDRNNPVILGCLNGKNNQKESSEDIKGFKDPDEKFPLSDYENKGDLNKLSTTEDAYLFNQVLETESGIKIEICDKNPDKEDSTDDYIRITHPAEHTIELNSEKFELKTKGGSSVLIQDKKDDNDEPTITITHPKGSISIDKDGKLTISVEKDISITTKGKCELTADKDISITTKAKCEVNADQDVNLTAKGNVKIKGTKIDLN